MKSLNPGIKSLALNKHGFVVVGLVLLLSVGCARNDNTSDASGAFEATETIVSAEATGMIEWLEVSEGRMLKAGQIVGHIDSVQLALRKLQLEAQIKAVLSRRPDVSSQLATVREQLRVAERERERLYNLVQARAIARKLLEDVEGQIAVLNKQLDALSSNLGVSTLSISSEAVPLRVQIEQIDDQLARCNIVNPVNGTVLTKYAEAHEITTAGKPLYRIANLDTVFLRAYVSGGQLSTVKLGQLATITVDPAKQYGGTVAWISEKAEFTPKTIQTKDERANLVYAVKIRVVNDGYLKLGMYGEVKF
ncbi:MAG: efflux RND transporter periplasmic adaptor subunit [bacterium]|nr:efflux RND transporter periplasmic adaptor subunit [bacterium]